jgi:hypothetical protein
MLQLFCHIVGDYFLQSGWMANNKSRRSLPALVHACVYFAPFALVLHPSWAASAVIVGSHFVIDRWRVARFIVYAKEYLSPPSYWRPWRECAASGLPSEVPPFLAVWLMIIIDNGMHVMINALSLAYL